MNVLAAIDIGSNAIRLAIGTINAAGALSVLTTRRASVRLGHDVFRTGRLSPQIQKQGLEAFAAFEKILKEYNVSHCRAVATSALRDAKNSASFIARVKRATGITIEVISGDEEARLIYTAVKAVTPLDQHNTLLMDIGGGSVEITLVQKGNVYFSDSVNMGTVRLLEMLAGKRLSTPVLKRLIRQYAQRIKGQIKRGLALKGVSRMIGTGGNLDTIGELRKKLLKKKDTSVVKREELSKLYDLLNSLTLEERISKLELRPDRADVIIPAMALILGVMEQAKVKNLEIPHVGLREGILFDLAARNSKKISALPLQARSKQVLSYAQALGRRLSFDEAHAAHARKLSMQIFDQTQRLHKLDQEARVLLEVSALLHDVGYLINSNDHHKHSAYLIRESHFVGLDDYQRHIVTAAVRYHRGSFPSQEHPEWQFIRDKDRTTVKVLAGILRVVEELDREHLTRVPRIRVKHSRKTVHIIFPRGKSHLVERWGVEKAKKLLEDALSVHIQTA